MPFLSYYYCSCRKPGSPPTFTSLCENWWCYNDGNSGLGVISTQLKGNGRGRLNYGICYGSTTDTHKVTVYLNGDEISSVVGGSVLETHKVVDFDYTNLDNLKIEESGTSVFQLNSFSIIRCNQINLGI